MLLDSSPGPTATSPCRGETKRTALLAAYVFLGLNPPELAADEAAAAATMLMLAAGDMSEEACTDWLRQHAQAL